MFPPNGSDGPGEHVMLAEIREREPKGKNGNLVPIQHSIPTPKRMLGLQGLRFFPMGRPFTVKRQRKRMTRLLTRSSPGESC